MVPEAQHMESPRPQERIAPRIGRRVHVLSTIGLDHDACFEAREIDNEWPDRALAPKAMAFNAAKPEHGPQASFGVRHPPSQFPCHPAFLAMTHGPARPSGLRAG